MIGDSWEADILGARNFGIDQIHFDPNSKIPTSGLEQFRGCIEKNDKNGHHAPSVTYHEIKNNNISKTNTLFISHLEQLLIIL